MNAIRGLSIIVWSGSMMAMGMAHAEVPGVSAEAVPVRAKALDAYASGHYAEAAEHFKRAAELGDGRSAESLALMYRYSDRLYASQVPAADGEIARWSRFAAFYRFRVALAGNEPPVPSIGLQQPAD